MTGLAVALLIASIATAIWGQLKGQIVRMLLFVAVAAGGTLGALILSGIWQIYPLGFGFHPAMVLVALLAGAGIALTTRAARRGLRPREARRVVLWTGGTGLLIGLSFMVLIAVTDAEGRDRSALGDCTAWGGSATCTEAHRRCTWQQERRDHEEMPFLRPESRVELSFEDRRARLLTCVAEAGGLPIAR